MLIFSSADTSELVLHLGKGHGFHFSSTELVWVGPGRGYPRRCWGEICASVGQSSKHWVEDRGVFFHSGSKPGPEPGSLNCGPD